MSDRPRDRGEVLLTRRSLMLSGALVVTGATAMGLRPPSVQLAPRQADFEHHIPLEIGDYRFSTAHGLVMPTEQEMQNPIYDRVLTRIYDHPVLPSIMILIAYGAAQNFWTTVHRPQACYSAVGYLLSGEKPVALRVGERVIDGLLFSADQLAGSEQILYWIRIGTDFPMTSLTQKLIVARANLRRVPIDGILVRLSVRAGDAAASMAQLKTFAGDMINALDSETARLLAGSPL